MATYAAALAQRVDLTMEAEDLDVDDEAPTIKVRAMRPAEAQVVLDYLQPQEVTSSVCPGTDTDPTPNRLEKLWRQATDDWGSAWHGRPPSVFPPSSSKDGSTLTSETEAAAGGWRGLLPPPRVPAPHPEELWVDCDELLDDATPSPANAQGAWLRTQPTEPWCCAGRR